MIQLLRDFRLIPIVLIATGCLFALKLIGIFLDGSYLFGTRTLRSDKVITLTMTSPSQELTTPTVTLDNWAPPANVSKRSWMQEMFGFPEVTGTVTPVPPPKNDQALVTGSAAASKPKEAPKDPPKEGGEKAAAPPPVNGTLVPLDGSRPVSAAERAILERLQERRQELDKRGRELDMRETMLKEAEKKLEARMNELKQLEAKVAPSGKAKEQAEAARFKNLAVMYENMKAKDAAKIFDRLDIKVLIDMTSQINPRRMSEIMAQMSPEAAERLTIELAARANGGERPMNPADLPKIEGRPNGT